MLEMFKEHDSLIIAMSTVVISYNYNFFSQKYLEGIVSRDFEWPQMILMNKLCALMFRGRFIFFLINIFI